MDIGKELVNLADGLDNEGYVEASNKIDAILVRLAAKKDEKKEDGFVPILKMRCTKDGDDGSYVVTVEAPAGVAPNDPVVLEYMRKYGPYDNIDVDYKDMLADSDPNRLNKFTYTLRNRGKKEKPELDISGVLPGLNPDKE